MSTDYYPTTLCFTEVERDLLRALLDEMQSQAEYDRGSDEEMYERVEALIQKIREAL